MQQKIRNSLAVADEHVSLRLENHTKTSVAGFIRLNGMTVGVANKDLKSIDDTEVTRKS